MPRLSPFAAVDRIVYESAFRKGDQMDSNLFTEYITRYRNMVYRVAYSYMRVPADSEDIMQEVFLKLYQSGKSFDSEEHLKAWLIRVTINKAKDELKASRRKQTELISDGADAAEIANRDLHEAMQQLGEDYRIAVYLHYYEGYGVKEMARLLGISEANVKTRLKRAREKLRAFLTDDERSIS